MIPDLFAQVPDGEILENIQADASILSAESMQEPDEWPLLDLNTSDLQEIANSPILSPLHAQTLLAHRQRFGRLAVHEELQVIPHWDTAFIRRVLPFVYCGKPLVDERFSIGNLLHAARHEVVLRSRRYLQDKTGYSGDGNYPFYTGDPYQLFIRYRMRAGTHFSAGVTAEKDAGERFFPSNNGGRMDFFSWHVFLRPGSALRTLAIGDYQIQFGQGLTAWNGWSMGKSTDITQFYRRAQGIRPYSSTAEDGFYRGLAMSLVKNNWQLDYWFSYRKRDASLFPADSAFRTFLVSSISGSGFHRSYAEMEDRARLGHQSAGIHLQHERSKWRCELILHQHHFEHALWPGDDPYELFDHSGRDFLQAGIALRYALRNGIVYSESVLDKNGTLATLAGILLMPDARFTFSCHLRNYPAEFQGMDVDALREGSRTRNERGVVAGFQWKWTPALNLQTYLDQFAFPWLRYTADAPSQGHDWTSQLTYTPSRSAELYLRYRQEKKVQELSESVGAGSDYALQENIRLQFQWLYGRDWEMQTRMECAWVRSDASVQTGTLFFQECRYRPMGKRFSVALRWAVFETTAYASRIYSYEQDMPGSFSLPAVSGIGSRYYFLFRYRLAHGLDAWLRIAAMSLRNDRQPFRRDEVKLQLRWQFGGS